MTDNPMPDAPSTTVSYPPLVLSGQLVSTILLQPLKLGKGLLQIDFSRVAYSLINEIWIRTLKQNSRLTRLVQ